MTGQPETASEGRVFRGTNTHSGRKLSVTPANSTNRHLCYGRIILSPSVPTASFTTESRETGLICLSGEATAKVGGNDDFALGQYDGIYIPRDSQVEISTKSAADIAEFSAEVSKRYPLQYVPYRSVCADSSLSFRTGTPGQQRHINIVIGKNVAAGRLVLGFTVSDPGNWTS